MSGLFRVLRMCCPRGRHGMEDGAGSGEWHRHAGQRWRCRKSSVRARRSRRRKRRQYANEPKTGRHRRRQSGRARGHIRSGSTGEWRAGGEPGVQRSDGQGHIRHSDLRNAAVGAGWSDRIRHRSRHPALRRTGPVHAGRQRQRIDQRDDGCSAGLRHLPREQRLLGSGAGAAQSRCSARGPAIAFACG
jgi:hypothetical protein